MQLKASQQEFKQVILQPEMAEDYGKKWLHNFHGLSAEHRFTVYRDNIFETLTNALRDVYPLCNKIIGELGFKQLAQQFIHNRFPSESSLYSYGVELPGFIKTVPKLMANIPYLTDLASYEWLCHAALHDPLERTVTRDDLDMLNENKLSGLPLTLISTFGILKSEYPLQTIVEKIQDASAEPMTYVKGTHYFLIYRFFGEVLVEETSEIFYKGLHFLKAKKSKVSKPHTVIDLSNYMIAQNHAQEVGPFIHFLFNRNLIKKD